MPSFALPPRRRVHRTNRRLVALAVALLAPVAACSSGTGTGGLSPSEATTTADPTTLTRINPLTGQPMKGRPPSHGVFVVKVDNTDSAAPQVGLGSADLITEEIVEGGLTRLAAFYYSDIPRTVGPVRSMRASDIGIVKPARAVLVASGGAPPTIRRLDRVGIMQRVEGAPGFYRTPDRILPYNLMLRLPTMVRQVKSSKPTRPYLPFGSAGDLPRGTKATSMQAVFSPTHTTAWRFAKGKGWTRSNSLAAAGDDLTADNVLVLRVKLTDAGYVDPGGNPVPETVLSGNGDAVLLHGDRAVRATWHKPSRAAPVRLTTKSGPLRVPPGHTFVELVPIQAGRVVLGK
jgi:hypothetical protein